MRKSPQLYWILLILLLPIFSGVAITLSLQSKKQVTKQVIKGFDDKLSQIINLIDVFTDGDHHKQLTQPQVIEQISKGLKSDHYNDSIHLLKKIRQQTGLSYLYTLELIDEKNLHYILDGSEPDEFTPIGTIDSLPEGYYENIKFSAEKNSPIINPVETWENWGLIKTGFGPIHLKDGTKSGFIGADIKVDIIETREKQAMLALIICGVFGIFISFLAAIQITRKLVSPINSLKNSVMLLASGNHKIALDDYKIAEFHELAKSFVMFKSTINRLETQNEDKLEALRKKDLHTQYHSFLDHQLHSHYQSTSNRIRIQTPDGTKSFNCKHRRGNLLLWHFPNNSPEQETKQLSAKISQVLSNITCDHFDEYLQLLNRLGYTKNTNLFMINLSNRKLNFAISENSKISVSNPHESIKKTQLYGEIQIEQDLELNIDSTDRPDRSTGKPLIQIGILQAQ